MHANSAVSPLAPVIDFQMPCLFLFINGLKAPHKKHCVISKFHGVPHELHSGNTNMNSPFVSSFSYTSIPLPKRKVFILETLLYLNGEQ